MKRTERACIITQILTEHPNKDYSLGFFADKFGCAKSSISEDLKLVRTAMDEAGLGYVETTSGSKGGVRYVPYITKEESIAGLEKMKAMLEDPSRNVGGGYIFTTDLLYDPEIGQACAMQFAKHFASSEADIVVTIETRGIGVAMLTARLLDLPLVVIRREARVSEGATISINYYSGSSDRVQKMSLAKRAIKPGSKAVIIDDFMRNGGTLKGIEDMLTEFDAKAVGFGSVIVTQGVRDKKIGNFFPIMILSDTEDGYRVAINPDII